MYGDIGSKDLTKAKPKFNKENSCTLSQASGTCDGVIWAPSSLGPLPFLLCCLQLSSILSQASYIQCLHLSLVNVPFTACISSILRSPYTLYSQLHIPASKGVSFQELRLCHMLPEPSSPLDSWTHQSCIFFFLPNPMPCDQQSQIL